MSKKILIEDVRPDREKSFWSFDSTLRYFADFSGFSNESQKKTSGNHFQEIQFFF